jgi:spore coat polysaccharide biosynthesis predicted glycosyltransferase SpsG
MEITAVVGAASPNAGAISELVEPLPGFSMVHGSNKMEELMAWATVAVAAGGSTMWELACMRLPFLILAVADNQISGANAMSSAGAALNLGWYAQITDSDMQNALKRLLDDPVLRSSLSKCSGDLVDGLGATRVADRMRSA